MKVTLNIDHTVSKEEIENWINDVLIPNNPCVWGFEFETHHCGNCSKSENAELKAQIEIKTKEIELIKLKMRNCLNCNYYKTLKSIYESPIYDEDDLPYPCRDCENSNKWEVAEW